jgi:hypothetical protein
MKTTTSVSQDGLSPPDLLNLMRYRMSPTNTVTQECGHYIRAILSTLGMSAILRILSVVKMAARGQHPARNHL